MWNLAPPPGFRGFDESAPVTFYMRHLPHWRQKGATYFATVRLGDSLPQSRLRELASLRAEWERRQARPLTTSAWEQLTRAVMQRVESWLDEGIGSCLLREPRLAQHAVEAMHCFDGSRYELNSYVVMPNHLHVLIRPTQCEDHPLEKILGSWKQYSAGKINRDVHGQGALWQEESFDRIIRDQEHLYRALQYIGRNPWKAGLARQACPTWVRPEWEELGWRFEEQPS